MLAKTALTSIGYAMMMSPKAETALHGCLTDTCPGDMVVRMPTVKAIPWK